MTFLSEIKDIFVPLPPPPSLRQDPEARSYDIETSSKDKTNVQSDTISISDNSTLVSSTKRKLKNRHVQLIGISGVLGTSLFVAISSPLHTGGPASLFIAYALWSLPILAITVSTAEMVCYIPINSPFVRMAGRCCDDALAFMAGWNFWFLEGALIPFEIVAVNTICHYWNADFSPAITFCIQVSLYFLISIFAVKVYGEVEFWLSIGKVILAFALMIFTLVTMCGGNPKHDAFGFSTWKNGGAFAQYKSTGSVGYFRGFFTCLTQASFAIAGPDYLSMVAGETVLPRVSTMPRAFKQVFIRILVIFLGMALCVGVIVSYDDPILVEALTEGKPGAGSSPFVIAMGNMGIKVLPHIINGVLIICAFSSGNAYTYCSSRTLYGLALDHKAPKIFAYCNKEGVPILAVLVSLCWGLLSFMQLNNSSAVVLNWLINLITSCQLTNFCVMTLTYLYFRKAYIAQGLDTGSFTFKSWGQPYTAIFGFACCFTMMWCNGYGVFVKGGWDYETFLFNYLSIFACVILYVVWKVLKKSKWRRSEDVDLSSGLDEVDDHETEYLEQLQEKKTNAGPSKFGVFGKVWEGFVSVVVGKD